MHAIVLAGGLGTRLKAISDGKPKALMKIFQKPFIDYQIEYLYSQGVEHIYFALGFGAKAIISHIKRKNTDISFSIENEPLGTGGAIKLALHRFGNMIDSDFFVVNGDSLVDIDFGSLYNFHVVKSALASVALISVEDVSRFGSVVMQNNDISKFIEKSYKGSGYINCGVYVFSKAIESVFPAYSKFSLERDIFPSLVGSRLKGLVMKYSFFTDIGTPESYSEFDKLIRMKGDWK